jgi:hypothetical protein
LVGFISSGLRFWKEGRRIEREWKFSSGERLDKRESEREREDPQRRVFETDDRFLRQFRSAFLPTTKKAATTNKDQRTRRWNERKGGGSKQASKKNRQRSTALRKSERNNNNNNPDTVAK